ncbi:hypothetical protein SPRG_15644 [Saprolegnia parasitica CBS 223.65]|uniref:Uncharacterized protein n=1 Tax=Saprolegnia parasitica (strain CBS 223.65) TaxID=695850 RepID=A0A067BY30_SAPPC|nr:hypothetical protein SPRG_15644 [Saprolegnia parasitica CBS 223.65]KDO19201.1 hypothetical protein SPRG_15644 [Saprolegnia parasitica CBS 223.65]|eukprot:XP_012210101.1 hypothetical protein SPRG_15644 [Saprolegnia parasitica CBS 223.65]
MLPSAAIFWACARFWQKALTRTAASTSSTCEGDAALHWAAYEGHGSVIELLLRHGASVDIVNTFGNTPLHWAAWGGRVQAAIFLLDAGANIGRQNNDGDTPLHFAAREDRAAVVRLLLDREADAGLPPYALARERGHASILRLLDQHPGDPCALYDAAKKGETDRVGALLSSGLHPDVRMEDNNTPLHWAAWEGHEAVLRLLLEHGATVDSENRFGNTPLQWASWGGQACAVQLLIDAYANVNHPGDGGCSALHRAAHHNHPRVTELLLQFNADKDQMDHHHRTPRTIALANGFADVVDVLDGYPRGRRDPGRR